MYSFADRRTPSNRAQSGIDFHCYNFTADQFWRWNKAVQAVRQGVADARLLTGGDSNTMGFGGSLSNTRIPLTSWPAFMAARMDASGYAPTALGGTIAVTAGTGGSWVDNRFSLAGWGTTGVPNVGWSPGAATGFLASTVNGSVGVYTHTFAADKYDVYYLSSVATGAFSLQATGGSVVNIPAGAEPINAASIQKVTLTAASVSAANTVTFTKVGSGAAAFITMIEPWRTDRKQVRVANVGINGAAAVGWNTVNAGIPTASPRKMIENYAPHLGVWDLGGNDVTQGRSTAQFLADMQGIQTSVELSGDFVVKAALPNGAVPAQNTILRGYLDALIGAGIPVIDVHNRIGAYASFDAAGYMSPDDIHGNDASFGLEAAWVVEALRGA